MNYPQLNGSLTISDYCNEHSSYSNRNACLFHMNMLSIPKHFKPYFNGYCHSLF